MNISDFKTILEEAVHTKLYESSKFTKEQKRNLELLLLLTIRF